VAKKMATAFNRLPAKPGWEGRTTLQIAGEAYLIGGVEGAMNVTKRFIRGAPKEAKLTKDQ